MGIAGFQLKVVLNAWRMVEVTLLVHSYIVDGDELHAVEHWNKATQTIAVAALVAVAAAAADMDVEEEYPIYLL
jgi:hypothetical protein